MVNLPWAKKEYEAERGGASWAQKEREAEGARRGGLGFSNGDEKTAERNEAAADLRGAEDNATAGADDEFGASREGGLYNVASSEERADGLFTGAGRDKKDKKGKKKKGLLKRKGPMGLILALVLGAGGMMSFFGMTTELVSWKENLYSMFGQGSAIISRRSNYVMRRLLSSNRNDSGVIKNTIFGGAKFKINNKMAKKLSAQGIDYVDMDDVDGKPLKMLVFEDADGKRIPIVASDSDVPRANALVAAGAEIDIGDGNMVKLTDSGVTLSDARKMNKNFSVSYDTATQTFTGKIAGWFDNVVGSLYRRIVGKNARHQTDIDDPDEESVNKMLLDNASEGTGDSDVKPIKGVDEVDEDGNPRTRWEYDNNDFTYIDEDGESITVPVAEIEGGKDGMKTDSPSTEAVKSSLTDKAKKVAMMAPSIVCAVVKSMGSISATIGAISTINNIQYAAKYLEMADKIKAGEADEVVNMAMENLNTSRTVELRDIDGEKVEVSGSVTEGDGWNNVFSGTNLINENDPSALLVNREFANKTALREAIGNSELADLIGTIGDYGATVNTFRTCMTVQLIGGVVSIAADVLTLFTGGLSKVIEETIAGAVKGIRIAVAMSAIGIVINAITPMVARWFAGQLKDVFLGKTGGFALLSGAQNIMNSNLQMSTGRYADSENAVEVFALMKDVEEEWARYERATKSPFDITSRYTFFGALYNSVLPIINTSSNTVTSTAASLADLTKTSTIALISPSANAVSNMSDFASSLASEGSCSYLESVGVAGDFACNKYAGAYVGEMEREDPGDVYEKMLTYKSFDGEDKDGNPVIDVKSDYAKYIVSCVSSDTQPGTMSGAVQGFLNGINQGIYNQSAVAGGLVNVGRNFVPFEGALDIAEAIEDGAGIKWNSGLACTGKTGDAEFDDMIKTFSMYNLDQRVLENMGVIETNSTVGFLEKYYEENPLDYSFEGQIARVSGLSKEEVEDTLALIDFYNYIAQYDASERYAFGAPLVEMDDNIMFESEDVIAGEYILMNNIVYADVRNRVTLV